MPILAGTRLGPFEVLSAIGAGGMGEVYHAHDTKLGRDVAIKVLPEVFANDPQRLSRFQREAKMLAALNHPNIATIFGLEHSNSTHYLVMELVAGDTLADRVKRDTAVPMDESLGIAKQIADALEAAHEKGIIHRDLKPSNVKVTPDGKVKVLDFGLAKAFESDATSEDLGNSPTLSRAATMQGVILGTAAYMSPEQARGKAVDKRTDIWAFGCVLYELVTGTQAFHGEDITDILAAVVRAEPDWSKLPEATPFSVRTLLRRCLQKDRTLRMQAAGDLRIEIVEALAAPKDVGAMAAASTPPNKLPWVLAAALAIAVLALGASLWRSSRPAEHPLVRLDVDLGSDVSLDSSVGTDMILSPDGTRLVYDSRGRLFTRRLDQPAATELAGTDGAFAPLFSPDGQWVAFFAGGMLKKVSVEGGAVIDLCAAPNGRGGSWGEDASIVATLGNIGGLSRIPSAGGTPTSVTELAQGEATHRWPQILPGGKAILFTKNGTGAFDGASIEVMSLADHRRKMLLQGGTYGRYLPSGQLVYVNRGTLFAVLFDPDKLEVHGTPVPVLDAVGYSAANGSAQFDFSRSGTLVYRNTGGQGGGRVTVQWLDGTGKTQPLLAKPGNYSRPRLSPDGKRLGLEVADGSGQDLWSYDWQRDTMTRLTFGGVLSTLDAIWTPDSRYVAFAVPGGISWTRTDGAGQAQSLTQSKSNQQPWSFSPDGKRLAYMEGNPGTGGVVLWTVPVETGSEGLRAGKPEIFLQSKFNLRQPSFSPDGKWLAYVSNESGSFEVYVRAFPDKGGKWQISNSGGLYPVWSRNGRELFYRAEDSRKILVARYLVKGDSFVADKPQVWSEKPLADVGIQSNFDLAPDGRRFAVLIPAETPQAQQTQNHVIFLENFLDEVRRRTVPGTK
jgi:serine/threonine protein kinase/Tol biopolymer transport system component